MHKTTILCQFGLFFVTSLPNHISINSQPFLVGIVSILSPEWTHAITTIMSHPLSSESGKFIQKWILYHAIPYPFDFRLYWDPTDPYDNKLLQEYVGSNGSVVYLPSSAIKSLINLWNYMNLLIKKEKSVDQKCNAQYFQDDQWFNLTAHDMRRTLVNEGLKHLSPQIISGHPIAKLNISSIFCTNEVPYSFGNHLT